MSTNNNPFAYQDRLDRQRLINDNKKRLLCVICKKRRMNAIIDEKPYCSICAIQHFEKQKQQRTEQHKKLGETHLKFQQKLNQNQRGNKDG